MDISMTMMNPTMRMEGGWMMTTNTLINRFLSDLCCMNSFLVIFTSYVIIAVNEVEGNSEIPQ